MFHTHNVVRINFQTRNIGFVAQVYRMARISELVGFLLTLSLRDYLYPMFRLRRSDVTLTVFG